MLVSKSGSIGYEVTYCLSLNSYSPTYKPSSHILRDFCYNIQFSVVRIDTNREKENHMQNFCWETQKIMTVRKY